MLVRATHGWSVLALVLTLGQNQAFAGNEDNTPEKAVAPATHKRGGQPTVPRDQLPQDVALPTPDAKVRHAIAEGATAEELQAGAVDDELLALRAAERVLFSQQLPGVQNGWSFEVPESQADTGSSLGLPYVSPLAHGQPDLKAEDVTWLRSLTLPDLPVILDRRVVTYLKFYRDSQQGRTIAAIWTKKSGRYVAEMKAQFRRAGLPTDLVWLSMIESGHNPAIKSPAGAVGLWQFMPESGRMYGLVVDRWVDERRDPARSTQAAVRFLSDLYRRFGNWELAMAAYNMGYAGMSRAVEKYSSNDYWALSRLESGIPWETTLYVPKIFALAIVMNNRSNFGVGRTALDPPVSFDTVLLEPATKLDDIAKAARVSVAEIHELNPQFLTDRLPPEAPQSAKRWALRLPTGSGTTALAKLSTTKDKHTLYRTRLGDALETIAQDYGLTSTELSALNQIGDAERLDPGTVLLLPGGAKPATQRDVHVAVVGRDVVAQTGQRRVFYEVSAGDSLSQVASALGVRETELCRWNLLNPSAFLRQGMTLQVLVEKDAMLSDVRVLPEHEVKVLIAGSAEFHEHFEGLKGKQRVTITVREGDTLSGLGARYGMTVGSMERVNRRSRTAKLLPGEQLIVYTDKQLAADTSTFAVEPLPELPHVAP